MGYDEQTQAVVIKSPSKSKSVCDVSIINLKCVSSDGGFKLIEKSKGDPPLPELDKEKTDQRLRTAKERIGIGVSPEGQQLFDFIRKTISECYWNGQNIEVLNEVEIKPPYEPTNCTGEERSVTYLKSIIKKFYDENKTAVTT